MEMSAGGKSNAEPGTAAAGVLRERSAGKDTTTGHWEIAGVILEEGFPVFEHFPDELVGAIEREAGISFLGNRAASGTEVLQELGPEHCRTGSPILYTSADSVLQIAAHEEIFGLERLYALCQIARRHADRWRISRVIARPFVGEAGAFQRTRGRHDYAFPPPPTVLDALVAGGIPVTGVGKISDIFAGRGISQSFPTGSNSEGMQTLLELVKSNPTGLVFANLVDFDMLYGHRRDVAGYRRALEEFDLWLPEFLGSMRPDDLLLLTADHGNDPTRPGTDHTREQVPLLVFSPVTRLPDPGLRHSFADIAASLAKAFGLPRPWSTGKAFL